MTVENQTELHCDDCGVHFGDVVEGRSAKPMEGVTPKLTCSDCTPGGVGVEISGYDFTGEAA